MVWKAKGGYGPRSQNCHIILFPIQLWAPEYNLSNVRTPVLLYTGTNDWLVTPRDISILAPKVSNLVKHEVIQGWNHLDFMWATNAPDVCYKDLMQELVTRF